MGFSSFGKLKDDNQGIVWQKYVKTDDGLNAFSDANKLAALKDPYKCLLHIEF